MNDETNPKNSRPATSSPITSGPDTSRPITESDVGITTPDGIADCYYTHPTTGTHPGVIVWPDILGLRPAFRAIGRRLAEVGYSVLVVNPYYRESAAPIGVDVDDFSEPAGRERATKLAAALTPDLTMVDALAFVDYLDLQRPVNRTRRLGVLGYCLGGPMAIRTAAASVDRIGAIASFHGARLVTGEKSSPHLLVPKTRASALIAIAEGDDEQQPEVKSVLREAYDTARLPAQIEVYPGTKHGWCSPDSKAYSATQAQRAWSQLLVLFGKTLT